METTEQKIAVITCRDCGCKFKVKVPTLKPILRVECPKCKKQININFGNPHSIQRGPTVPSEVKENGSLSEEEIRTRNIAYGSGGRGKLVQLRGIFLKNISHNLNLGENTIGRYDEAIPSQIMVKGDNTISRRSVSIQVRLQGENWVYSLRVLKSMNPVVVQGREITNGEEIYLNFGDIIQLGRTKFRFEKK